MHHAEGSFVAKKRQSADVSPNSLYIIQLPRELARFSQVPRPACRNVSRGSARRFLKLRPPETETIRSARKVVARDPFEARRKYLTTHCLSSSGTISVLQCFRPEVFHFAGRCRPPRTQTQLACLLRSCRHALDTDLALMTPVTPT